MKKSPWETVERIGCDLCFQKEKWRAIAHCGVQCLHLLLPVPPVFLVGYDASIYPPTPRGKWPLLLDSWAAQLLVPNSHYNLVTWLYEKKKLQTKVQGHKSNSKIVGLKSVSDETSRRWSTSFTSCTESWNHRRTPSYLTRLRWFWDWEGRSARVFFLWFINGYDNWIQPLRDLFWITISLLNKPFQDLSRTFPLTPLIPYD